MGRYNYTTALEKLTKWANKEGYAKVDLNHAGISYISWAHESLNTPKAIYIEGKHTKEIKTYLLLHELGHHQLRKDWDRMYRMLPITAHAEQVHWIEKEGKYKRRVAFKVSCMEEEFKAWDEGYKLAMTMGIRVNLEKWSDLKYSCLLTYMRYYGDKNK